MGGVERLSGMVPVYAVRGDKRKEYMAIWLGLAPRGAGW